MLIDTHCHLDFESYDGDRNAVLERAAKADVRVVINPATDLTTSRASIALSKQYEGTARSAGTAVSTQVLAVVGVHPNSTANFEAAMVDELRELAKTHDSVVAIGEIGIDYYWDKSPRETQIASFEAQLALAAELELPVIIHNREASEDIMAVLEAWVTDLPASLKERPGVMHSFSAPPQIAERALAAGFYLGFTGPITYKNADELRHIAATVPDDRIVVETDGPFLTPVPYRGKRNEPAYIPLMVERLAALKTQSVEDFGRKTTENAIRLFRLPVTVPQASGDISA
jgi:TatD DNase family protein